MGGIEKADSAVQFSYNVIGIILILITSVASCVGTYFTLKASIEKCFDLIDQNDRLEAIKRAEINEKIAKNISRIEGLLSEKDELINNFKSRIDALEKKNLSLINDVEKKSLSLINDVEKKSLSSINDVEKKSLSSINDVEKKIITLEKAIEFDKKINIGFKDFDKKYNNMFQEFNKLKDKFHEKEIQNTLHYRD